MRLQYWPLLLIVGFLHGQTLEFEVASFKPAAPGQQGGQLSPRPGNKTYAGNNMTLRQYMSVAYQVRDNQLTGPVTAYATMQACGIVNDHLSACCVRDNQ